MTSRRQYKKKELSDADIPTASFSDLAFLLIIFFILTTTMVKETGFVTDFPSGEKGESAQKEKAMTVALSENKILFNDQAIDMPGLRRKLMEARLDKKIGEEKVVLLMASGSVKYQDYFETMSIINAASGVVAIVVGSEQSK